MLAIDLSKRTPLHPSTLVFAWVCVLLAAQHAQGAWLVAWLLLSASAALLCARSRFFLLMRRARWLFMTVLVVLALGSPGEYLWPALGPLGPTHEGLFQAVAHLGALVAVFAWVALLLQRMGPAWLVMGVHGLLHPMADHPPQAGSVALRLLLVLREVDRLPAGRWREWLLQTGTAPALRLRMPAARCWVDFAIMAGCAAGVVGVFLI